MWSAHYLQKIFLATADFYEIKRQTLEINACKLYINSFIDSSLLNDDGVVKPKAMIERRAPEQSNFLKRAYRTRVLTTSSM
ncbi:MAG: hypothetical protein ACJASU_000385 [Cognaticolwellia sp.]